MKVWLNGEVLESDAATISVRDHGLTVGDGVFETAKVVDGTAFALTRHLNRLQMSADRLGLAAPSQDELRLGIQQLLDAHEPGVVGRLRLTVTGGDGPPGTERGTSGPTVLIVVGPASAWPGSASLCTVPWARNERSAVAGAKTTSYAENVVALAYAKQRGAAEALFLDTRGYLCEGTGSNVFVVVGGRILTPALSTGCLAGVTRALVVEWSGAEEAELLPSILDEADEVFITSSTRDVQPVSAVDARTYLAPGPVTALVAETFGRRSADDVDP